MTALLSPPRTHLELLADAVRAPSSHNSQPWLFRVREDRIDLFADRTRALPVNDPHDRELVISCGAALTNLCAAAVHHHLAPTVHVFPDDEDPDHLAAVDLTPVPAYSDARVSYGIHLRSTWRTDFLAKPVPADVVADMRAAAEAEGAWVHVVDDDQRTELAGLVTGGDHFQFADHSWRRELAAWMHPRRRGDGLLVPPVAGAVTRFVVSHVDIGDRTAREDAAITLRAPLVLVLGTEHDDERAWLTAGRALERLLLTGAVRGVQAGFSNQPCQVAVLRPQLAQLVGHAHPQMVLRLGFPPEPPVETPRRPVADVLLP